MISESDFRSVGTLRKQMIFALRDSRSGNACIPNEIEAEFYKIVEFHSICIVNQMFPERDFRSAQTLRKQMTSAFRNPRSGNAYISNENEAGS